MNPLIKLVSLGIVLIFLVSGCQSTTRHGVSSNLVNYLYPDGKKINHNKDLIPHLELPLRVGIAFIPESYADPNYSLTEAEKSPLLEKVAKQFEQYPFVESIEIIPELYLKQGKGFATVSQVAALHGIDVMALVSYDHVSINEENDLAFTYLTVIGAFLIPGESTDAQTFVDTAVFDVKTNKLLFRAPGAATDKKYHSFTGKIGKTRDIRNKTFDEATTKMIANLDKKLAEFRTRVKQKEVATVSYRKNYSGGGSTSWIGVFLLLLLVRFARDNH